MPKKIETPIKNKKTIVKNINEKKLVKTNERDKVVLNNSNSPVEQLKKTVLPKGRPGMKLVMAISKGFYGNCKIRRGQKFYIPKKEKLGQWMIPADKELPPEEGFKLHGQASKATPAFLEKPGQLKDDLNRAVFAE